MLKNRIQPYTKLLLRTQIFSGVTEDELYAMLGCLSAEKKTFKKGEYILRVADTTTVMGLVLCGSVFSIQEDLWGSRNIIATAEPGETFAEANAASAGNVLNFSVVANEDCEILLLDVNRILTSCSSVCTHHGRVIRNLVSVLAQNALGLHEKITHVSKHTTKEKLLSFLSAESLKHGSLSFDISYNRQQLADYLCVERAAMSVELSKLKKSGLLTYERNHFSLHPNAITE